jgi:GAF domain-containing protein
MTIQPSMSLSKIINNGQEPSNINNAAETNHLLTNIFNKLPQADTEENVLQVSVEITHQVLKCDRVVVYSLQQDSFSQVVAESVTAGYAQILDSIIKDPCFEAGYIEKYQKGRIRAVTDIYQAGLSDCYIANLEKIQVKANLVVPLIRENRSLYGLLVMHQCSRTRQWQQSEVEFLLKIADWTMVQMSQKAKYERLQTHIKHKEKWQKLQTRITQDLHTAQNSAEILQITVDQAKNLLKCDRVVVYCLQPDSMGKIVAESTIPALAPILGSTIKDPCFEHRYIDKYQQGRITAISNIYEAGMSACYVENLEKIAVKANLVMPINWDNGEIYGLLVAHQCFKFRKWQYVEIEYLKQITLQTGLSLSKAKLKERIYLIESTFSGLDNIRDMVTSAKSQIQQIQQPIQDTSQILTEVSNLNQLLDREINLINQNGSAQTQKDTKLVQIVIKKLALNTVKLKKSLNIFNHQKNIIEEILENVATSLHSNESEADN